MQCWLVIIQGEASSVSVDCMESSCAETLAILLTPVYSVIINSNLPCLACVQRGVQCLTAFLAQTTTRTITSNQQQQYQLHRRDQCCTIFVSLYCAIILYKYMLICSSVRDDAVNVTSLTEEQCTYLYLSTKCVTCSDSISVSRCEEICCVSRDLVTVWQCDAAAHIRFVTNKSPIVRLNTFAACPLSRLTASFLTQEESGTRDEPPGLSSHSLVSDIKAV